MLHSLTVTQAQHTHAPTRTRGAALLHLAAWYAAGDVRIRVATAKAHGVSQRTVRLLLALAAIEELTGRGVKAAEARALAVLARPTVVQLTKECEAAGLIIREGRTGLRLSPAGRDIANDFARRMRRHLEAVESLIEERGA